MKKLKKFLAGVMALAMAMSMMTMTAFAAEPTIDMSKSGTLTIHKYEKKGADVDTTVLGLTGTTADAPTDPEVKPMQGVGFTVYKIGAGSAYLESIYSATNPQVPKADTYVEKNADGEWQIKSAYTSVLTMKGTEAYTNAAGEVTFNFTSEELGVYLVMETKPADSVSAPVKPFVVSIPMTTKAGDDWNYDVHVYPKNATDYKGVVLKKVQKVAGNETETGLAGVEFLLQKKVGEEWISITHSATAQGDNDDVNGKKLELVTDENGMISIEGLTNGEYRFIEKDLREEATNGATAGFIKDSATAYEFEISKAGVKLRDSKGDYALIVDASNPIKVVNEKPDLDKTVTGRDGSVNQYNDADYNVGDKVPYTITVKVPSNIAKLKVFNVTDTPVGLVDIVGDTNYPIVVSDSAKDAIKTGFPKAEGNGFKIEFDPAGLDGVTEFTITYFAELQDTAKKTTAGNPNTATLEYSHSINSEEDDWPVPDDEKTWKIEDKAVVYTFQIDVIKTENTDPDGSFDNKVYFDLYKKIDKAADAKAGNTVVTAADATKMGFDVVTEDIKFLERIATDLTTTNGTLNYPGLAKGDYWLVETKTKEGYNLLKAPVKVELNIAYATTWTKSEVWKKDETTNNEWKLVKRTENSTTFTGTQDSSSDNPIGLVKKTIVNKKGFELPQTGGMGTFVFTFVGVAMMAAAVILFFTSKKKEAK